MLKRTSTRAAEGALVSTARFNCLQLQKAIAPVLFPKLRLIQGYQVRFIALLEIATPHSKLLASLLVAASQTGFDHTTKIDYSSDSEEMLEVEAKSD